MSVLDYVKGKQSTQDKPIREYENLREYNSDKIRLVHIKIESNDSELIINYNASTPFLVPDGMKMPEAYKTISYVSENIEKTQDFENTSLENVTATCNQLKKYGFKRLNRIKHGHIISVTSPNNEPAKINEIDLYSTIDLFVIEGDFEKFKESNLYDKYVNWFRRGIKKEEIKKLYNIIKLPFPEQNKENNNNDYTL